MENKYPIMVTSIIIGAMALAFLYDSHSTEQTVRSAVGLTASIIGLILSVRMKPKDNQSES